MFESNDLFSELISTPNMSSHHQQRQTRHAKCRLLMPLGWLASTKRHTSSLWLLLVFVSCFCGRWACSQAPDSAVKRERGLLTLVGASSRTFRNEFKRNLKSSTDQCLRFHSSGDWWHYEWCIDRFVRQFHAPEDDSSGDRLKPATKPLRTHLHTLGRFKAMVSLELEVYALSNLSKLPRPAFSGYLISQLYASGDVCHAADPATTTASSAATGLINGNRSVEIRYTCCAFRANETYIESVVEQPQCQYALTVCTPVACGVMQQHLEQQQEGNGNYQSRFGTKSLFMSDHERLQLLDQVKQMFYHAYDGYMTYAFPQDQLNPISCRGETFELGKMQFLTLIDTLDTLAVLEDAPRFQEAVQLVVQRATFDLNTEVSVFETTIRVLGGLLSAHLFAIDEKRALFPTGNYDGALLRLAIDLADRLLPAFMTDTGIPYGTVNLREGVPFGETKIASTAGAGSLSMEFTMLSVLTGDAKYANVSRRAVRALYERRSKVDLVGKHIDTSTGEWSETISGPGSNSDSFYEYLMKMYMLFGDEEAYAMLQKIYDGVMTHNLHGDWFADVSMFSGCPHSSRIMLENLACFWPGMQVSLGHLGPASQLLNAFYRVWREFGFVPEQFNVLKWKPQRGHGARYPLRPELIESTFFMHDATKDPSWLRAGEHFVQSLEKHAKTSCGYASIADVDTKKQEDTMPSFFLSETCKYLVLLFNTSHFLRDGNYVFTTEAHPFPLVPSHKSRAVLYPTIPATSATPGASHADGPPPPPQEPQQGLVQSSWQRRQCDVVAFDHPFGYDVTYSARVEDHKPRCDANVAFESSSSRLTRTIKKRPLRAPDGSALDVDVMDLADLSDAEIAAQLKELIPQLQARLKESGGTWGANHDELVKLMYQGEPFGRRRELGTLEHAHNQLGEFTIDQSNIMVRVTRKETKEYIQMMSVTESLQLVTFGHRRSGTSASLPPMLSRRRFLVQKHRRLPRTLYIVHEHRATQDRVSDIQRICSLRLTQRDRHKQYLIGCVAANFGRFGDYPDDFLELRNHPVEFAIPLNGCSPLQNEFLMGKLVIVTRGECFFETKAQLAMARHVAGLIVINNEDEDQDAVMVMSRATVDGHDQDELMQELNGAPRQELESLPIVMVDKSAMELFHHLLQPDTIMSTWAELLYQVHETGSSFPMVTGALAHSNFKAFGETWGFLLVASQPPNQYAVYIRPTPSQDSTASDKNANKQQQQQPQATGQEQEQQQQQPATGKANCAVHQPMLLP